MLRLKEQAMCIVIPTDTDNDKTALIDPQGLPGSAEPEAPEQKSF